ncbi:DEAD/DEAH box helicase [Okibacterium endophyticum]
MSVDTPPLVDTAEIVRVVGRGAFDRARVYARQDAVLRWSWAVAEKQLTGFVAGSEPRPYSVRILLAPSAKGYHRVLGSSCSCPLGADCKHVAATLLASNEAHVLEQGRGRSTRAGASAADHNALPEWKRALDALAGRPAASARDRQGNSRNDGPAAMGLQFEMRENTTHAAYRWSGPVSAPLTAASARGGERRLCVRPVMRNARGNWVKADLTWNRVTHQRGLDVDREHQRWMVQFAALSRTTRDVYYGQSTEWLQLDDFQSPLLWSVLADAVRLGIGLVGTKKGAVVRVGDTADLRLDASRGAGAGPGADLTLTPVLTIDGETHDPVDAGVIGDHGVYTWSFSPAAEITLAPTVAPLTAEQRGLVGASTPLTVPSADVDEFMAHYYPRLRRTVEISSADATVQFPEIRSPELVLTAAFKPKHVLTLDWAWEYPEDGSRFLLDDGGRRGAGSSNAAGLAAASSDLRDGTLESGIIERVTDALGEPPRTGSLSGLDAAEFAENVLDTLDAVDGVRVAVVGDRPDYRELSDTPTFTVTTVETEERDWFDLGVIVKIEGREIPFGPLFTALATGRKKLLLIDGSYFSLQHPAFDRLRELLVEAESLQEWEPENLRISRYQAGLWAEFEDLADETHEAVSWRATVSGLSELSTIAPPSVPVGVHADLRDYQLNGFAWLAFLHDNGLGGILADDMGLGKTLQTLALIAHARETRSSARAGREHPFLVVAPTSVVSNWVAEARRFTPGLAVTAVTATRGKRRMPLADIAGDADIVVTSYALFRLDADEYKGHQWSGLILDEAQFVKNRASRAHAVARELPAPFKLAITGTPMENNLMELWSLFAIVAPGLFPSARQFTERYVRPIEGTRSGVRNRGEAREPEHDQGEVLARLHRRIRPLMMRRTKELVATELPEKQEQVLRVELAPRHKKIYDTYLQRERRKLLGLIDDLDRNRFIVFRSLTLLRMLSLDASLVDDDYAGVPSSKLDALFEQLDDVIAEGHRALVFSQFTSFLGKAAQRLDAIGVPYASLDGSTTNRGEVISRFTNGEAPVFLISLKAGGFGLNLTEADYVFLLDPWWNPASEAQAIDRTHRIGQTKNVMVYRLVASDTIEEKVMALKEKKAKLFSQVMDDESGAFSSALSADDIRGLLE